MSEFGEIGEATDGAFEGLEGASPLTEVDRDFLDFFLEEDPS